jgi:hypothetical protein
MPPAFVFLIVNESVYFSGRVKMQGTQYSEYSWDNPPSPNSKGKIVTTAGPFQIIRRTAYDNGISTQADRNSPSDERNYFTSAACGAANYLASTMDKFRDPTLGIMGYFQGPYAVLPVVRAAVKRYADFSLTYADIARNHMVDPPWITYVAKVVAAYFIAGDYPHYQYFEGRNVKTNSKKFTEVPSAYPGLSRGAPTRLSSPKCQQAFSKVYSF